MTRKHKRKGMFFKHTIVRTYNIPMVRNKD